MTQGRPRPAAHRHVRWLVAVLGASIAAAGCDTSAAQSEAPSSTSSSQASPTAILATPIPTATLVTPTPTLASPTPTEAAPPPGTVSVAIPLAGIALPVPSTWVQVSGSDLVDPAVRADLTATYPGADRLLAAADSMADRAQPVFLAVDPASAGDGVPLATNVAVLVSQPPVSGPLLDLVAGFISAGFQDAFGAAEPDRTRVATPVGDAVRLDYALPGGDGTPLEAVAWVVGAASGTLLISAMGSSDALADLDPDALIAAATHSP